MARERLDEFDHRAAKLAAGISMERGPLGCVICDSPTLNRGVFVPEDSEAWGAPQGKRRYVAYPLCNNHPLEQTTWDVVEPAIKRWLLSLRAEEN